MRWSDALGWKTRLLAVTVAVGAVAGTGLLADNAADWPMFGRGLDNTAGTSSSISIQNIRNLSRKWELTTTGDVSARATVVNGIAYFPDWGPVLIPPNTAITGSSTLWAVNVGDGSVLWSRSLNTYGLTGSYNGIYHSRTSPAIDGGVLFVGSQEGGHLLAIEAATGNLVWRTQLESADPYAIVTTSPAVYNGVIYTGVASLAETGSLIGASIGPQGGQVKPRGSAVAVSAATGEVLWKTYMAPTGYYGAGVWGSSPAIDPSRNTVYVSTGNNYANCDTYPDCNAPDNYVDSVVALDMVSGQVKWANKLVNWNQQAYGVTDGSDNWNVDCLWPVLGAPGPGPQCPVSAGPDYDFAAAPNLITFNNGQGVQKTILGAGQKSGIYSALDPDTGAILWQTQVGPGSVLGGMQWGSASDGQRIYVSIGNLYGIPHKGGDAGSWAALNIQTGRILCQTADPNGAIDIGPMTVANNVVYASSMAGSPTAPTMIAMNAATGRIIWSFAAGASVNAGATVVGGTVLWGSGYGHLGFPGQTSNNKFYAFSIPGK